MEEPMAKESTFDLEAAHRFFSANCFNKTWDLIIKIGWTPEEDLALVPAAGYKRREPVSWLLAGQPGVCFIGTG
jgi:hypothetical protein